MATYNISGNFSNITRYTGLASGLDTDQIVRDLMSVERIPLTKLYQKKQLTEWRQEAYRDIISILRSFKDKYFNITSSTNMLSANAYKKYKASSTNSNIVTVSGNADSASGTHTISVYNLATADKAIGSSTVTRELEGGAITDYNLSGKTIKINLDGTVKEISLDNYANAEDAAAGIQAAIDAAFGSGKVLVEADSVSNSLKFSTTGGATRITLLSGSEEDGLSALGFEPGASNRINVNESLFSLSTKFKNQLVFNDDGKLIFTINGKPFEFDQSTTLRSMMNAINADKTANVTIQYDEVTDTFSITAKQLGEGDNIIIDAETQEGNFFGAGGVSGINTGSAATEQGVDAKVKIDGELLYRSSNNFTVNGIKYTLQKAHANPDEEYETVGLELDVDAIYEGIKNFVDKYNEIIADLNSKISEKYDRGYLPLTDEQKEEMSEDEIKKWEEKAKTGLLHNDATISDLIYKMRRALYDSVEEVGINLTAIGITTGNYSEKGKLVINETKLREAIANDPESIVELFSKKSSVDKNIDLTEEEQKKRYEESGLAYRLSDILDSAIRTTRDKNGNKGTLLEKAGLVGDGSEALNMLSKEIKKYDDQIKSMMERLEKKENSYYKKFTLLEKYINQMNAQSMYLTSMLTPYR